MSRADQITRVLKTLSNTTPDIEAAAVVDNDGLMIASSLPADVEDDSVAAMSAAMLGLSERIASELERGDFQQVTIKGSNGYTVLARCGDEAVLTVMAGAKGKLGLIYLDTARASKELARLLG